MSAKPRRCSKRWLDGDCPDEVLAIIDTGDQMYSERYDVFYVTPIANVDGVTWLGYYSIAERGGGYHGEMPAHEVAAYRYRMKHNYVKWSTLPDAVKQSVRNDLIPIGSEK